MEETVVRRDLRHLTHPSPIQAYAIAIKLMRERIRRDGVHVMRVGGGHATARLRSSSQPCRSHKARQTLRARGEPRGTQFFVRARGDLRPRLSANVIRTWTMIASSMTARQLSSRWRFTS